jgi:Carboxypeptidase regulatory-like domain
MAHARRILLSFFFAAGLLGNAAFGQPATGGVKGTLEDESGAVIPAVNVTLTGNGTTKTAQSQADGSYSFTGIAPGQYAATVTLPGFQTFNGKVTVAPGATATLPIQLSVQLETQQVTVAAENTTTVSVEPENNQTALVISGQDLQALPDDPDDLSNALQALAGPGAGPNGGQLYIDGFSGGQLPPKETIREVRINQNPFSAEYDRLGFGRIEILTKPGTGTLHGMVFFNDSNAVFDSRNPFAANKPDYSNRQYGGNVSGPINKKMSFFLDYNERDITNNAITYAVFLNPSTLQQLPVDTAVVTPQMNRTISPRLDYQLNTNNTLTVRFEERMNYLNNDGLGGYHLPNSTEYGSSQAYNLSGNAQNLMITETNVINSRAENETRFQYYRNWTQSLGNQLPEINVANSFITGGNGIGDTFDRTHHFELQNYTSLTRGAHTIRFGARGRRDSDQYNNPQGFNGAFTFLGGEEPVLDNTNQPTGATELLTSIQQYQRNLMLQQAGFTAAQIQALGGGPSRYTIQTGIPYSGADRFRRR